jgi:zinc transport system substrate-binding protein
MQRFAQSVSVVFGVSVFAAGAALAAEPPKVVTTIPAVHSIVSGVMTGVAEPGLLIPGGASPHSYSLKPSDARALADANLVVWVGPALETFLSEDLETLAPDAKHLEFMDADGVVLRETREGGVWAAHDHAAHGGHDDHEGHAHHDGHDDHKEHHDHDKHHDHEEHAGHDHHDDHDSRDDHAAHGGHEGHGAEEVDAHVWLDPRNAVALSRAVAAELSEIDPARADTYAANHSAQAERLAALEIALAERFDPIADVPFIVFHDAYQYLEARYGLSSVGSVTVSPELAPGAARVREIQELIADRGPVCVFAEPQFEPRILTAIVEGSPARTGVLDPVGATIDPGTDFYGKLMNGLADDMTACMGESS